MRSQPESCRLFPPVSVYFNAAFCKAQPGLRISPSRKVVLPKLQDFSWFRISRCTRAAACRSPRLFFPSIQEPSHSFAHSPEKETSLRSAVQSAASGRFFALSQISENVGRLTPPLPSLLLLLRVVGSSRLLSYEANPKAAI